MYERIPAYLRVRNTNRSSIAQRKTVTASRTSSTEPPIVRGCAVLKDVPGSNYDLVISGAEAAPSKFREGQFVRSLSTPPVSFRRSRIDQVAVRIKSAQKSRLSGLRPRLKTFQCIFIHEK
jgi:hypothetical protein